MVMEDRKYTDYESNINSQINFTWFGTQSVLSNYKYTMLNLTKKKKPLKLIT